MTKTRSASQIPFGYTCVSSGDSTQLTYLRSRYYASGTGRFLTRDTRGGDANNPMSYNQWAYVMANPINRIDPSGMCYTDPNIFSSGYWSRFLESPLFRPCTSSSIQSNTVPATSTATALATYTPTPISTTTPAPIVPFVTPTLNCFIPTPPTYPCTPTANKDCRSASDDPVLQIAHTIYGEGGAFGGEVAANVLQTIVNRAYTYWVYTYQAGINPDNIPWNQMTKDNLTNLILFILSEPTGTGWPSYNAWRAPEPHHGQFWQTVNDAVTDLLNHPGVDPSSMVKVNGKLPASEIRFNANVQFYAAAQDPWQPANIANVVHVDTITRNGKVCFRQFYGTELMNPPDQELDCPS